MNDTKLKITEIFHSIQGETTLSGERFSFIRLTGCPLRCTWCDTTYSFTGGHWMTINEIISEISKHDTKWVLITGGEPLSQKNTITLVNALNKASKKISIETSGEIDVSEYVGKAKIIMDIKTPSSGEEAKNCFKNLEILETSDEIKFVIENQSDYEFSKKIFVKYNLNKFNTVLFSPVFGKLQLKTLSEWILQDRLNVRLQTQLHKHIWGENQKGV